MKVEAVGAALKIRVIKKPSATNVKYQSRLPVLLSEKKNNDDNDYDDNNNNNNNNNNNIITVQ